MIGHYRVIFAAPGSVAFSAAGFVARLPIAMVGIGIVTMLSELRGNYALAGALAAVFALANAVLTPVVSRAVDRYGQSRVLPVATAVSAIGIASMLLAVRLDAPDWALFVCVLPAGFMPTMGAMVRARWTEIYRGSGKLRTAFAFEAVLDEVCFIAGPVISVGLSVAVFPEAGPLAGMVLLVVGSTALVVQRGTEPPVHPRGTERATWVMRNPAMWMLVIVMVSMGTIFGVIDVSAIAVTRELGAPGSATLVLALFAGGSATAGLVFGTLDLVAPLHRQLLIAVGVLTVLMLPLLFVESIPAVAVAYVFAGAAVAPTMIVTMGLVERTVAASALTEGMTWTVAGLGVGVSAGSALAGQMIDRFDTTAGFAVAVVAAALASMVSAWLFVRPPAATAPHSSTR
ncbi:MFS transporter [Rhodococcus triatomae]|uniref:Predicted arabinose efflux permease, MFS family n=1 Tax=Rhodococcus triatomae TaxID=300028 RepID=A0A1G8J1S5_9NOCA|nr:MFS transporter [Rhodococcus triatomae]QNG19838.1 MFS transporter [Rhodococcus triatomae]QNG24246.1 MFS transporter [Rhodococcus triatomae]SDI25189.1 Predicted arabinose efflux permease, MFS family [Rhodococcus triatomae]